MRTKAIIRGFKNSQKFRFILKPIDGAEVGLTLTIQQMSDQFATTAARTAVWCALEKLALMRNNAKAKKEPLPTGLVRDADGFSQVQIDIH